MSIRTIGLILCLVFLSIFSCSGPQLKQVEEVTQLPQELPAEIRKKFEIEAAQKPKTEEEAAVAKTGTIKKAKKGLYPNRRPVKDPIWVGEKMSYRVSFLGMSAGLFTLEAMPYKEINNRKVYHIFAKAESNRFFSLFYRLNDTIETFIDYEGIFSHRFHLVLNESKQNRNSLELYDSEKKQTFFWNRWSRDDNPYEEKKEFFPMEPFSQDTLSSLYYMRTLPLNTGDVTQFPIVSEGKILQTQITVVKREALETPMGKIQAIVVSPETGFKGNLKKEGDSFIWFSDDDRRIVLKVEAKVKIGKVAATLEKFEPGESPE